MHNVCVNLAKYAYLYIHWSRSDNRICHWPLQNWLNSFCRLFHGRWLQVTALPRHCSDL